MQDIKKLNSNKADSDERNLDILQKHLYARVLDIHDKKFDKISWRKFYDQFRTGTNVTRQEAKHDLTNIPEKADLPALILSRASKLLTADGFVLINDDSSGKVRATFTKSYPISYRPLGNIYDGQQDLDFEFVVRLICRDEDGKRVRTLFLSADLPTWVGDFKKRLTDDLEERSSHEIETAQSIQASRQGGWHDRFQVLGPGMVRSSSVRGISFDYSGCAKETDLEDLDEGELPLGTWAFGWPGAVQYGNRSLFLPGSQTNSPIAHQGVLLCGAKNSGKTQLIKRWALAANRAKSNILVLDVKGGLFDELSRKLDGNVFHFTTDPKRSDGDLINFLHRLCDGFADEGRVRTFAQMLMPRNDWDEQQQDFPYDNHVDWLTALIQLLALYEQYYPNEFVNGIADLSDLYAIVSDEANLYQVIDRIEQAELRRPAREPRRADLDHCKADLAPLIHTTRKGRRKGNASFHTLTRNILNALRPFSRHGTFYSKTSFGTGPGDPNAGKRVLALDALDSSEEPVAIFLSVRKKTDADASAVMLPLIVKWLEDWLLQRKEKSNPTDTLVLLDETYELPDFDPLDFTSQARDAKAGSVVAYRSLREIGEPHQIKIMLENVGTQIFLGSLTGETARNFIEILPTRKQPSFSVTTSSGLDGSSVQTGQETVEFFTTAELYSLPGGKWPALVYINSQPKRPPFITDLDEGVHRGPAASVKPERSRKRES
jgi:hypothetical protein